MLMWHRSCFGHYDKPHCTDNPTSGIANRSTAICFTWGLTVVNHVRNFLRITKVAHAFCALPQFSQVVEAASKLELSKHCRIRRSVIQFEKKKQRKALFSAECNYELSMTPAWTKITSKPLGQNGV